MSTDPGSASVVVTHRERFTPAIESLESLLATIPRGTRLVYVDAGSPRDVADALARAAVSHDFLLLRVDDHLAPNTARNLALPYLTTDFVVFADNDVRVEPGWLDQLVACAVETQAWLANPVIVQEGEHGIVAHMSGGACGIHEEGGRRRFREDHHELGKSAEARPTTTRHATGFVEFHCVLVSRAALDACFPLDEELRSARDHCDLTLQTQAGGGGIWMEPAVTVTQMYMPDTLPASDRRYYRLRWSDAWNRRSIERFQEKWDLDPDDPLDAHDLTWLSVHRLYGNRSYGELAGELPSRPRRAAMRSLDRLVQTFVGLRPSTRHPLTPTARVVHTPSWQEDAEPLVRG